MDAKAQLNAKIQSRYDELMAEGKHGHYESMFQVFHELMPKPYDEYNTYCGECQNWDGKHDDDCSKR